ncbi:MAG TPA: NAD(P)H-hydrate dehydratase [Rhabdochlamydiaceae bacterium]|nr:NAD(P)H-hydrate dehydratase [Rhabdochlamydiaceae bacterium]
MNFILQGKPVVTAEEMVRIEKLAYAAGADETEFMKNAGHAVAKAVEAYSLSHKIKHEIYLLLGKGNKAGDAFTAGAELLKDGYAVIAYHLYPLNDCSPLCQKQGKKFKQEGGIIQQIKSEKELLFNSGGIIIDGLLGTGFHGKAEGLEAAVIDAANRSAIPILAIDIPSGLNGSTGEVGSVAIRATQTLSLGLPKLGFFIRDGWNYVGKLASLDFGLASSFIEQAQADYYLINDERLSKALPIMKRTRHKYEAGYVIAVAGSSGMSGAALMACFAALRSGAGIVRLFYPSGMELSGAPLELLKEAWDLKNDQKILTESKRAKALMIGPGMGRSPETKTAIERLLKEIPLPCVMDADALYFLAENPALSLPAHTVLTPHKQEMQRLLGHIELSHATCQHYVEKKKVTLVLKGAPTFVFHPQVKPLIIPHGDPGMATAGTGDVLTGMIGAFLAQGLDTRTAACLSVALHGLAGEQIASRKGSQGMIATDLIQALPSVFQSLKK